MLLNVVSCFQVTSHTHVFSDISFMPRWLFRYECSTIAVHGSHCLGPRLTFPYFMQLLGIKCISHKSMFVLKFTYLGEAYILFHVFPTSWGARGSVVG
jgi:hypothetical protein